VNLLFIELNPDLLRGTEPFIVAYFLDSPGPFKKQWRVDAQRGVEAGIGTTSMRGVWGYLKDETWLQVTQHEAYARFPELQQAIESWVAPW